MGIPYSYRYAIELGLSFCTGIKDVSALVNVRLLILWGCTGITDFSAVPHATPLIHV